MRTSGQKIPEWRQRIFWSPFQWRNFESGSLYLVHIYAKDLKDLDAGCTYMLLDSCSPLDVDFTIKNNKNNGTLTRRLATTYFLEYPTFNMWHHCGCCLCRLFFFKHSMLTQDSNVQMGEWSKHIETSRNGTTYSVIWIGVLEYVHLCPHQCWCMSYHCVLCRSTFLLVEFWFRLRLPIILALIGLFCFFQGDTWGKFPDVPPAPVAGETESSSPRW